MYAPVVIRLDEKEGLEQRFDNPKRCELPVAAAARSLNQPPPLCAQ